MEPLVSIVIPVYNVAEYLRRALDSVIRQTYTNLEIIIVDDGSDDGSAAICDEYAEADSRISVIHQVNRGLSNARNAGLDRMTGEFLAFLDPDDLYQPDYVQAMVTAMETENPGLVMCRYSIQDTKKHRPGKRIKVHPTIDAGSYDRVSALRAVMEGGITYGVWNKLYRRRILENLRFYDGHVYEDGEFTFSVVERCQTVFVLDRCLYCYCKRPGSITQTVNLNNVRDRLLASERIEAFIRKHPEVFTDAMTARYREGRIRGYLVSYIRMKQMGADREADELRDRIISTGTQVKMHDVSTRAAYRMICWCPWLLRAAYRIYSPIRLCYRKVTGQ